MNSCISFKWGGLDPATGLDCFTLASYVSECLFQKPFDLSIKAIARTYEQYPTGENLPPRLLLNLAKELGLKPARELLTGTLVILRSPIGFALGTIVEDSVLLMGPNGSEVRPIASFDGQDFIAAHCTDKLIAINNEHR
jgi:hypothetical protein